MVVEEEKRLLQPLIRQVLLLIGLSSCPMTPESAEMTTDSYRDQNSFLIWLLYIRILFANRGVTPCWENEKVLRNLPIGSAELEQFNALYWISMQFSFMKLLYGQAVAKTLLPLNFNRFRFLVHILSVVPRGCLLWIFSAEGRQVVPCQSFEVLWLDTFYWMGE